MKLITECNFCSEAIKVSAPAATRPDLEMIKGENFEVKCKKCGKAQQKTANEVLAVSSLWILSGGFIIGIVVTVLLWNLLGAIGLFSFLIPVLVSNSESNAVAFFNSYRT